MRRVFKNIGIYHGPIVLSLEWHVHSIINHNPFLFFSKTIMLVLALILSLFLIRYGFATPSIMVSRQELGTEISSLTHQTSTASETEMGDGEAAVSKRPLLLKEKIYWLVTGVVFATASPERR